LAGNPGGALPAKKIDQVTPASAPAIVSFVAKVLGSYQLSPVKFAGDDFAVG
jgi:hypothetical protein